MADEASRKRDREETEAGGGGSADPDRKNSKQRAEGTTGEADSSQQWILPTTDEDDEPEDDPLFAACAEGNFEELKRLHAEESGDVNSNEPEEGDTLLGVACRFGHVDIAKWLIANGARLEQANNSGEAPLHECCLRGNEALVRSILPQVPKEAYDAKTAQGMTPIAFACLGGHTAIAQVLHEAGASVKVANAEDHTLLHLACCNGHLDSAKWAHSVLGADSHAAKDSAGRMPMHLACGQGELATVQWLHSCGAPLDTADERKNTPAHFAAAAADESRAAETAAWLIDTGAKATATNADGNTPLHHAAQAGALSLVKKLLGAGAKATAVNEDGDSAFLLCCFGGHIKVAEMLLGLGGAADATNSFGCSGLVQASAGGHAEMVKWLLGRAPELLSVPDSQGMTALDHAKGVGAEEVVKVLMEHK
jgi:ankyrin repeat protein